MINLMANLDGLISFRIVKQCIPIFIADQVSFALQVLNCGGAIHGDRTKVVEYGVVCVDSEDGGKECGLREGNDFISGKISSGPPVFFKYTFVYLQIPPIFFPTDTLFHCLKNVYLPPKIYY